MGNFYRLPYFALWKIKVSCLAHKEIIFGSIQFRKPAFPKPMDSILAGKLTIIIFCTVKGYVDIPQIMAKVSSKSKNCLGILFFKGINKVYKRLIGTPWRDSVFSQAILSIYCFGICPESGKFVNSAVTIYIQVYIMFFSFAFYGIPSSVGVDGFIRNIP